MLLTLNALAHFGVDGLCAAAIFGWNHGSIWVFLLYNTLAFSTQCLLGLAADRLRRHSTAAAMSLLLVAAGWALPLPLWLKVTLIGLGNSGFHVAGGCMTLEHSNGRSAPLGIFVAPGAVGLTLGTLWPKLGGCFAVCLVLCALTELLLEKRGTEKKPPWCDGSQRGTCDKALISVLLALAVAVRAVGGAAVLFPWKTGVSMALLTAGCIYGGKTAGGFVCDRLGPGRTASLSIIPAALLIAFCSRWAIPSLLGQFALNLTMPVTLWLLYRNMPDAPGFAFGLAASALWPGTLAGQLMILTGPALWLCVILSFVFGLCAILFSQRHVCSSG